MANMSYALIVFLILIQFSWVKCYEVSYCDDENSRQLEYSVQRFEPYPINSNKPFTVWIDWNFRENMPCSALFHLTAVKSGEDKSKCDKNMTLSVSQVFQMIKQCMKDKNAEYFCINNPSDFRNFGNRNMRQVEKGPMQMCVTIPKIFVPGFYDIYAEVLKTEHKVISCCKFQGIEFK
ncbi:uncharacterized protein LOC111628386 [Centruroides sculpturatus]|uniref:uncharacterized protein LOC111628386 n=1 Tax=Centruroides sculpturatus TaxID=218467 RepID=UPI000C6CFC2E|nr:uncharacterized protein LOC111628386 [Centruroides sculpturatus]